MRAAVDASTTLTKPNAHGRGRGVARSQVSRAKARNDTRAILVRRGLELLTEQALDATGIDQILKGLGIPKGSFYHFFPSKQAYGEAVIDGYAAYFDEKFDRLLGDVSRPPLSRLRAYLEECRAGMARYRWRRGCLVGNLAQELGGRNEAFRQKLEAVLTIWQDRVADCLREAVVRGDIDREVDVQQLAAFFWIGWEGALMRAKLTRDSVPLDCFINQYFALLPLGIRSEGAS